MSYAAHAPTVAGRLGPQVKQQGPRAIVTLITGILTEIQEAARAEGIERVEVGNSRSKAARA